jgi:hypothetical protein
MKEYYYRFGAYFGILTSIIFAGEELYYDEDTNTWVPIEEESAMSEDTWM